MPTSDASLVPPLVRTFMQRNHLPDDAIRADGRVVLTVDDRYRVHIFPAPFARIALQAELLALPEHPDSLFDDLLLGLANTGAGMLGTSASTLCIDRKRQAVALQQSVALNANQETLQEAMADFVNALAFWSNLCRKMAASRGVAA